VDRPVIREAELEDEAIKPLFPDWDPAREVRTYLETIFEPDDHVGYITKVWTNEDGDPKPTKGYYDRTRDEILSALDSNNGDVGAALGDTDPEAGAWIRFNPLDGTGVKNENVTEYRYGLVECDNLPIERQLTLIRELQLPAAVIMFSGNKSIHAVVHVDARDNTEYRRRVSYIYDVCEKNGFSIDKQNKNPSRMSRLPGVKRGEKRQYLIGINEGKKSFSEWKEWIEGQSDDLPELEILNTVWDNLPELSPPLIDGVLRQGHKMLLSGPSKAGKSFALIRLAIAIAEGWDWLGWQCAQGRVIYVNLELDRASCLHRFKDVYEALGREPTGLQNVEIWNLRGKSVPMDQLVRPLIRRAGNGAPPAAIIVDPIYKVITGDENSASDMARFTNQFDRLCREIGCSVIYCHHHSKGAQGGKRSADRASGSGVFARDPDALVDMIELAIEDNARVSAKTTLDITDEEAETLTAWRIETTLREFPTTPPVNAFFCWPCHYMDNAHLLDDADTDDRAQEKAKTRREKENKKDVLERMFADLSAYRGINYVPLEELAEALDVSVRTVRRRIKQHNELSVHKSMVYRTSDLIELLEREEEELNAENQESDINNINTEN
jgi:RecA-family ATPase